MEADIDKDIDEAVAYRLYFLRRVIVLQELRRIAKKEKDQQNQSLLSSKIFFLQGFIEKIEDILKQNYNVDVRCRLNNDRQYLLMRIDREIFTNPEYKSLSKKIGDIDDIIDRLIVKYTAAGYNSSKFKWFDPDRRIW